MDIESKRLELIKNTNLQYHLNKLIEDDISLEEFSDDAFIHRLFVSIFKTVPNTFLTIKGDISSLDIRDKLNELDLESTYNNIKNNCVCFEYTHKFVKILISEDWIYSDAVIRTIDKEIPKEILDNLVFDEVEHNIDNFIFVSINDKGSFIKKKLPVKDVEIDFDTNYNADFPKDKIQKVLESDESGLLLLYGSAGTGKTSSIRYFIRENPDINFYWLDSSMFRMINSTSFMEFLLDCQNSVFILEDCESVLKSRDDSYNDLITPILNISDGILGDSLHLKFICTFNTSLLNIDKALLRKGRLSLQYEYNLLSIDRVQAMLDKLNINQKATKEMPLCDIYNIDEDNGTKEKKKIGF